MVAIRSMGLALESLVGFELEDESVAMVSDLQLGMLVEISAERFKENTKRIERFQALLREMSSGGTGAGKKGQDGEVWEDPQARRERKRIEGLKQAQATRNERPEII